MLKHLWDWIRANLLSHLASEAVALVVANNPKSDWAALLQLVIAQLQASSPTQNSAAIERAAAAALINVGIKPKP